MKKDFQTRIDAQEAPYECVFVDRYDDNEMWLSIHRYGTPVSCVISFDEARKMVEAMNRILGAKA